MIRIVSWAILFGMLSAIHIKQEEVDALSLLVNGSLGLMLLMYVKEFMREHNLKFNFKDLW